MSVYVVTRRAVRSSRGASGWEYSAWKLLGEDQTIYSVTWITEGGTFGMLGTESGENIPARWSEAQRVILAAHPELRRERWEPRGAMVFCYSTEARALFEARDAAKLALREADWALNMPRETRLEE